MSKHTNHREEYPSLHQGMEEEIKPKRRSFLQHWIPKFKSSSPAAEDQKVEIESPLAPVELPHIEQLQPINTDISSEIQFQQQQQTTVETTPTTEDEKETNKDDQQPLLSANQDQDIPTNDDQILTQVATNDHPSADADQSNKKDPTKRSSLLLKLLCPKRCTSPPSSPQDTKLPTNGDHLLTDQQQQDRPDLTHLPSHDPTQIIEPDTMEEPLESIRPSSPLGRRVSALLSRIPTLKDKTSGRKPKPMDDGKLLVSDDTPGVFLGYENEKLTGTTEPSATAAA